MVGDGRECLSVSYSLNCLQLFITMKIFDKGNTGTKYKCDIGLLASMETLPLSHSVLDTHHNQTLITYHSFSPCCLFPAPRPPPLSAVPCKKHLAGQAWEIALLFYPNLPTPNSIPSAQGLPSLAVLFDRLLHDEVLMPGLMPEFPAPRTRFLELYA